MLASLYPSMKTGLAVAHRYSLRRVRKHTERLAETTAAANQIAATMQTPSGSPADNLSAPHFTPTSPAFVPPYANGNSRKQARRDELARRAAQRQAALSLARQRHASRSANGLLAHAADMSRLSKASEEIDAESREIENWTDRSRTIENLGNTLADARRRLGYFAGTFDSTSLMAFALYYNGIDITPLLKACWVSVIRCPGV